MKERQTIISKRNLIKVYITDRNEEFSKCIVFTPEDYRKDLK